MRPDVDFWRQLDPFCSETTVFVSSIQQQKLRAELCPSFQPSAEVPQAFVPFQAFALGIVQLFTHRCSRHSSSGKTEISVKLRRYQKAASVLCFPLAFYPHSFAWSCSCLYCNAEEMWGVLGTGLQGQGPDRTRKALWLLVTAWAKWLRA